MSSSGTVRCAQVLYSYNGAMLLLPLDAPNIQGTNRTCISQGSNQTDNVAQQCMYMVSSEGESLFLVFLIRLGTRCGRRTRRGR